MEIVQDSKNFRLVSVEELPDVANILVQYLPESLKFHQTIETYLKRKVWDFHFYVAKNWPEEPICLHYPGFTNKENKYPYESVAIFCPSTQTELVDLLTSDDKLLDLTQPLYLNFTHEAIIKRLENHYEVPDNKVTADVYYTDKPVTDNSAQGLPPGAQLGRLRPEHVEEIYVSSPANDVECREVYEQLVAGLPAFGIFVDGQLAAWMIQVYYGAMFAMQTKSEFRRKGYGTYIAKHVIKEVAALGYKLFVIIRSGNEASRLLYTKLGFEKCFRTIRGILQPRTPHHSNTM